MYYFVNFGKNIIEEMLYKKLAISLLLLTIVLFIGSIGYVLVEGDRWTLLDALFMTVTTLSTVGYSEVHPLSYKGRIFTIVLIFIGAGFMAYVATSMVEFIVEGGLREIFERKKMKDKIKNLKSHYIVCGAGDTGLTTAKYLLKNNSSVVLIDRDSKKVQDLISDGYYAIEGDATVDEVLLEAGVCNAAGLVSALPHDADNVFVVLTVRGLNPNIYIVATATKLESVSKLKRAGVNYVVSPNITAASRMASVLMRPSVVDFLDATLAGDDSDLQMDEFSICKGSYLENKMLKDADIRKKSGAIIVAVKHAAKTIINPEPTYVFESGDILVVLGTREQINKMAELAVKK